MEEQALPRSPEVIRTLVQNHREFLGYLERRVGSRDVAEDILHDAFARGIDRIESLRDDDSAVGWFYRTLRNAVIDYHRRQQAAGRALDQFARELEHLGSPTEDVHGEVCRCISRLAQTLKPEYAEALERIEIQGVPVKAYADERGISASNAAVRVFRAREALRKQVAASCGTCADHGCLDCTCEKSRPAECGSHER